MENKSNKSIFDRLDDLSNQNQFTQEQNKEILNLLEKLNGEENTTEKSRRSQKRTINNKELLDSIVKESSKEYMFFGSKKTLDNLKIVLKILCVSLIIVVLLAAIFTSLASKMFVFFSILEIIWVVYAIKITMKTCNITYRIKDYKMKELSCYLYEKDKDNTFRNTGVEFKRYKVFRILSYITVVCNLSMAWYKGIIVFAVPATIFELMVVLFTILITVVRSKIIFSYGNIIIFDYDDLVTNESIQLIGDYADGKLYTYDNYMKKYGDLFK